MELTSLAQEYLASAERLREREERLSGQLKSAPSNERHMLDRRICALREERLHLSSVARYLLAEYGGDPSEGGCLAAWHEPCTMI